MLDLQSIYFGRRHKDFGYEDYDIMHKVKRLYHKHHRQCENACNGAGYIKGQWYYLGAITDYARRTYGHDVKSGYVSDDVSVFDIEIKRIEDKILHVLALRVSNNLSTTLLKEGWRIEFQHDPRGHTVKLYYEDEQIRW